MQSFAGIFRNTQVKIIYAIIDWACLGFPKVWIVWYSLTLTTATWNDEYFLFFIMKSLKKYMKVPVPLNSDHLTQPSNIMQNYCTINFKLWSEKQVYVVNGHTTLKT